MALVISGLTRSLLQKFKPAHKPARCIPSIMSLIVSGIFCLTDGSRRQCPKNPKRFYNYYSTALGLKGGAIPCELRVFSRFQEAPLPQDSLALVYGRAAFPSHSSALLDAIDLSSAPGDPTDEGYQETQFDSRYPLICAVGTVHRVIEADASPTKDRAFIVRTSEYVRDATHSFQLAGVFLAENPRWKNTRLPPVGSTVYFSGRGLEYDCNSDIVFVDCGTYQFNVRGSSSTGGNVAGDNPPPRFSMTGDNRVSQSRRFAMPASSSSTTFGSSARSTGQLSHPHSLQGSTLGSFGGPLESSLPNVTITRTSKPAFGVTISDDMTATEDTDDEETVQLPPSVPSKRKRGKEKERASFASSLSDDPQSSVVGEIVAQPETSETSQAVADISDACTLDNDEGDTVQDPAADSTTKGGTTKRKRRSM